MEPRCGSGEGRPKFPGATGVDPRLRSGTPPACRMKQRAGT